MPATRDRIRTLISDNLDLNHEPDFSAKFSESGVSSLQAVAFFKLVDGEFGLGLNAEDCRQFQTLQQLEDFIDSRA